MGYHAFRDLGQNGTCYNFVSIDRYTYVHVCSGSELDYTNGQKDFILGPRLEEEGQRVFSSLQGVTTFLNSLGWTDVFSTYESNFKPPGGNK